MPNIRRSFTALASLALAILFISASAFSQDDDGPADIPVPPAKLCQDVMATDGVNYFLVGRHLEAETCVPDAPIVRVETAPRSSDGDCPPTLAVNLDEGGAFFIPRMRNGDACVFPRSVNVVQPLASSRTASSSGVVTPSAAPRNTTTPLSSTRQAIEEVIASEFGGRNEFIAACDANEELWLSTFEQAESFDHQAVGLTARAPHINRAVRYPVDMPELATELTSATVALAEAASRLKESSRADHAPLASLWTKRTLRDYDASSCGELYHFTIGAFARHGEMTVAASMVGHLSRKVVLLAQGEEAADRHWQFLNGLAGETLLSPSSP